MEKHINILRSDRIRKKGGQFHPPHYSKCWDVKLILIDEHNFHNYITLFSVFKFCSVQRFSNLKWWENLKQLSIYPFLLEACVAEQVTPQTPDLKVWDSSLTYCVVFLDKELYSTLLLFYQVFKWVPVTCWWGLVLTLQWTSILSKWQGE